MTDQALEHPSLQPHSSDSYPKGLASLTDGLETVLSAGLVPEAVTALVVGYHRADQVRRMLSALNWGR